MKNFYRLLFIVVAIIGLSACKKDTGDQSAASGNGLIGKWQQISSRDEYFVNGQKQRDNTTEGFPASAYIQFDNDGTGRFGGDVYGASDRANNSFNFKVEDDTVRFLDNGGNIVAFSGKMTQQKNSLVLKTSVTFPNTDKGDITIESTYNFTRVK